MADLAALAGDVPRLRVAAAIVLDELVLLVRHRAGDSVYHLLPGGGVRYRETLEEALVREVLEETGLVVEVREPLFISDTIDPDGPRHVINLTFLAEVVGGVLTESPDDPRVEAVELVSFERLTMLDLRPPIAAPLSRALRSATPPAMSYLGSLFTSAGSGGDSV
jgi:ADP-ribose pyrophosphatase YjhB (NUDIX family)